MHGTWAILDTACYLYKHEDKREQTRKQKTTKGLEKKPVMFHILYKYCEMYTNVDGALHGWYKDQLMLLMYNFVLRGNDMTASIESYEHTAHTNEKLKYWPKATQ